MDVAAIARVAFTSEDRVRDVIPNFTPPVIFDHATPMVTPDRKTEMFQQVRLLALPGSGQPP
jgi:hypothetical protein